ncbi:17774_t:CDS:2 [Funneliformis geosporum]|uniref:1777_t:CDS:1 n=1 Tax=Funneliformis geosporum TaxID=1117311 RepID=A0A9W4SET2_9GLOM|nr:1777_t:CDS:2 [Funneliformis geosporum]CAI2167207.1 17774_t:CDS:2 [Funneliformis geosporum]
MEDFQLLETMLYERSIGFYLLEPHLNRLIQSASHFSEEFNDSSFVNCTTSEFREFIKATLQESVKNIEDDKRRIVRLTVDKQGVPNVSISAFQTIQEPVKITLDTQPTLSSNKFLYHKTTKRDLYKDARIRVGLESNKDLFDVILYNENHEITECSIANIAVEYYDAANNLKFWKTPQIECGLLGGTMRSHLIENGDIIPGVITLDDIKLAQQV